MRYYCPYCGREIKKTDQICPYCRTELVEPGFAEPVGVLDRIKAAVGDFFGDGPENRSFVVAGAALLAAVVIVGVVLAHGIFSKKTGTTGTSEVASNTGVTTSSTGEEAEAEDGANTGTVSSSKTGKDNTDNVIDTTPTDEMKKRQEEAEKRKAEKEAAEKAEREAAEKKAAEEKAAEEARKKKEEEAKIPATAEEAFKALYQGKKFLYGQQFTCYLTDPDVAQEAQAQGLPVGLDITEIPEGEMAYYVYDFDEDGAVELLTLVLSQDRTILATMYEFDGENAMAANQIEVEMPANADGIKRSLPIVGGVPAFANAFVYKVDDDVRIGFEFAHVVVHANGTQHDILSYVYEGDVFELRDSFTLEGSTIEMVVMSDVKYYKELREKFAKLGAGDMSQEDIAAMWSMKTHFSDHIEEVREIFRAENRLTASGFDYSKWTSDGKKRTEYSKTSFTAQADLFKGKGAKYKAPGTVPIPEENADGSQQNQDNGQQGQDENGQQNQDENGQQNQDENSQQNQENVTPEEPIENPVEETPDPSDQETGDAANPEESANNSGDVDLSFLDGVWERLGGHMEGVEQPTMVFDGYTAHCHSTENGDYDVTVAEIVETDYGYFLRMDSGSGQFGYRWYRDTPNQLDRVDTWDTEDLSTYSGTDSYVRVE